MSKNGETSEGGITRVLTSGCGLGRGARLKASGTTLSLPGRCSMTKSNSAKERHHLASFDFGGAIEAKNFKFAWSVITLNLQPIK